jgi:RNA polymerase sigma factor (sigma-70 family)
LALVNRKLFPEKSPKELLVQFRETGSQEPFEEIVRRYAAMVYGVCLRVTGDKHDAEDATQAVFLSLALQAKTSREITYIGPWLQKVAHRLALDVKKSKTRRKKREEKLADQARNGNGHNGHHGNGNGNGFFGGNGHSDPADAPAAEELKKVMMEELNKLPAKYRMPLVLHYFGGLSREEMAAELGCNPSTLGVRVHRGKAMLGTRLAKRGVAVSAIAFAVVLEHVIRTTTVQPLMSASSTASAAAGLYAGGSGASIASAKIIALTRTIARSIVYAKLKVTLAVLLLIMSAAVTTGSVVSKYIDLKNLHLPSLNLGDWIRPLLKSLTPSLRADSTPQTDEVPGLDEPIASAPPIKLSVDWDKYAGHSSGVAIYAPPQFVAPAKTQASGTIAASPVAPSTAKRTEAQLNALAQAMLNPPVTTPITRSIPDAHLTIGSDQPPSGAEATADPETAKPVLADATDFNIGAGGGGGSGKPELYVLPANTTLHSNNQTIGDTGSAIFRQLGGANAVTGTLTLGKQKGSSGTYQLNGGTLTANDEIIGGQGSGAFLQSGGVNVATNSIIVGNNDEGAYTQSNGLTYVLNADASVDPSQDTGGLHLGEGSNGKGSYLLAGGTLAADPQLIGVNGSGSFTQTGGSNTTGAVAVAINPGSTGVYKMIGGKLTLVTRETNKPETAISIGGAGKGSFDLGDINSAGAVYQVGGASSVVVRGQPRGSGSLLGYGKVELTGALVNNGQIVADGFKNERTLDLSSFSWVTSTIENPRWGGTAGWFARRDGRLVLPSIPVSQGNGTYTWGEDNSDPMIDLVNSVRFKIKNVQHDGEVSIALLSPLRDDIPTLPEGHHFIGVWSFDGSELGGFDGAQLTVRYDDAMARTLGLDENILKLWRYDPAAGQWDRINDSSFIRDSLDHLLTGYAPGGFDYFAVSAPEPAGATLLLIGISAAALRRRRRTR